MTARPKGPGPVAKLVMMALAFAIGWYLNAWLHLV